MSKSKPNSLVKKPLRVTAAEISTPKILLKIAPPRLALGRAIFF